MPYLRHFILGTRHLGTAHCKPEVRAEQFILPDSFLYMCPTCGDVWARSPVESAATGKTSRWQALAMGCAKHPEHSLSPAGTMLVNWVKGFDEALPDDVVKREFQLYMNYFTQGVTA